MLLTITNNDKIASCFCAKDLSEITGVVKTDDKSSLLKHEKMQAAVNLSADIVVAASTLPTISPVWWVNGLLFLLGTAT